MSISNPGQGNGSGNILSLKVLDEDSFKSAFEDLKSKINDHSKAIDDISNVLVKSKAIADKNENLLDKQVANNDLLADKLTATNTEISKVADDLSQHAGLIQNLIKTDEIVMVKLDELKGSIDGVKAPTEDLKAIVDSCIKSLSAHKEIASKLNISVNANSATTEKHKAVLLDHEEKLIENKKSVDAIALDIQSVGAILKEVKTSIDSSVTINAGLSDKLISSCSEFENRQDGLISECHRIVELGGTLSDKFVDSISKHKELVDKYEELVNKLTSNIVDMDKSLAELKEAKTPIVVQKSTEEVDVLKNIEALLKRNDK